MLLLQIALLSVSLSLVKTQNFEILTKNFFENLKGHPFVENENSLNEGSKQFIDKQIDNYVKLVTGVSGSTKKKRSLLDEYVRDERGTYILSDVEEANTVPIGYASDAVFFVQDSARFVAALESPSFKENADRLVVFAYENETFTEKARVSVSNATKVATVSIGDFTLIAVAENAAPRFEFPDKSGIFQFDSSGLVKIQSVDMHYASDIVMWRIHDEVYMSISQFMSNNSGIIHYEIEIPIYKWLGKHFDLVQNIKSKGASSITPFTIRGGHFLAIANSRDDSNATRLYSEIHKFNYQTETYALYQRILTEACSDIEVFTLPGTDQGNTFLVVANLYQAVPGGEEDHETDSIIYKFVDDYFIPFQSVHLEAAEQWLPIQGPNSEFALLVSTRFDGIKAFQYNGWTFQETQDVLRKPGIKSLRSVIFGNTSMIVVSGHSADVFRLKFTHRDPLNQIYIEMMTWCDRGLRKVKDLLDGAIFETVLEERADIDEDEVSSRIDSLSSVLDRLKVGEITANEVVFNNVTFVQNLNTTSINNFPISEILDNVLDIEEGFEVDTIKFDTIKIDNSINAISINGFDSSTLVHNSQDLTFDLLTVEGSVEAPEGINIGGTLNGVSITESNLLLRTGDQNFSHPLNLIDIKVDTMAVRSLTGASLVKADEPVNVEYIHDLVVKNLTVGGYINDVDVPTLAKYALKIKGNQRIVSHYMFDQLHGKNLEVAGHVSGRKLSDLIDAEKGNFIINQDMIFKNDVFINDLEVADSLNRITVNNSRLDVLLKNQSREQAISGDKVFDDIIIYHAISLQGHISSKNLEKMNPVVSISDNIFLEGDKKITGQVNVEDILTVADIAVPGGTYSMRKLQAEGLQLKAKEVKPHLLFHAPLNVDEIFVDTINGRDPHDFVITGSEQPQIIEGSKTFTGDLRVTGSTNALNINNVDVEELESRVLKVDGDQTVVGKHHIKHVRADRIWAKTTDINKELPIDRDLTVDGDFELGSVGVEALMVKGLVNDLSFDEVVNDTVQKDSRGTITGNKYFYTVTTAAMDFVNGISFDQNENFDTVVLKMDAPLVIGNIKVDNLYFEKEFNGVDKDSFGAVGDEITTVDSAHVFDTITVFGNAYIASNRINHLDLAQLQNDTVKVDEPFEFDSATFDHDVVTRRVTLDGQIENFDLDNLLPSAYISAKKTFKSSVTINGSVTLDALNGVNLTQFRDLAMGQSHDKNITINGGAFFTKGPKVAKINGIDLKSIKDRAWFSDRGTTLTGTIEFGDLVFENDVTVGGFVDNISLNLLHENYFSKSKDQEVTATFAFENGLVFESDVAVSGVTADRAVINGVDLEEFVHTALLDGYDQTFENVAYFEDCLVRNLTGDFTVNGLNINKDVMRYDDVNMVTGPKIFDNLDIVSLKLDKNIKIQDVDVLDWFRNSALKTTGYNITGTKKFKHVSFTKGFRLGGALNGLKFDTDHVVVKDVPQEITGRKTIRASALNPVFFKGIKLKGLLNGVDVSALVNNQAYKNQDNVFKSSVNSFGNISTSNLVIKKLYNGINMTELIFNVTNLGVLNNLLDQYHQLMEMSYTLKESIENQAYFVHHYRIVETLPSITNSQKIKCLDGVTRLGTLVTDERGTRMDLYGWQREKLALYATIKFSGKPTFINQVLMGRYFYIEESSGLGHFSPTPPLNTTVTVRTNRTSSTTSFVLPVGGICTLFTYYESSPRIFCENGGRIALKQILESPGASKAWATTVATTPYLIVITRPIGNLESHIDLWKFSNVSAKFELDQSLFIAQPISVTVVYFRGFHYLAVASGHLSNAMYAGKVEICRFDGKTSTFVPWQSLDIDAPVQVKFAVLPSNELVLYIVSDNPTEPLLIYTYEGLSGFQLKVKGSALPQILHLNQFEGVTGSHFIVAQSHEEINVLRAVFKGGMM